MSYIQLRPWLICWLYGLSIAHLMGGILISWFIQLPVFAHYHQNILTQFGFVNVAGQVIELQIWWLNLFGATLQNLAIFMGLLIYVGNRTRISVIWGWMIFGLLVWALQDMYISAQREVWMHLWIDSLALILMLPPLFILWRNDSMEIHG